MPSAVSTARPTDDAKVLRQRLAGLRRRLRRTAIVRGFSWLILFTSFVAIAAGLLDWLLPLPSLLRAGVLASWLVGAGLLFWRHLYQPLTRRSDDLSLALRVEQRFPVLNDALASTVQFLDASESPDGESTSLRREAVRRAMERTKSFDFNRVVDSRGLRSAAASAAFVGAAAVTLLLLFPGPAFSALGRLLNPFNNRDLPPQSRLILVPDPPPDRIGKDETYEVHARIQGVLPPNVRARITVRIDGYSTREYPTDVTPNADKTASLSFRLEKVQRDFHFRVSYNDAASKEYAVKVLPPPELVRLSGAPSPQLELSYPRYTGLPSPRTQTPGVGDVDVVLGTSIVLRAAADRPLDAAWIEYSISPHAPAAALGYAGAAATARVRSDAELDADRTVFTIRFQPMEPAESGLYALHLKDDSGIGAAKTFGLAVHADPKPNVVRLDRPSKSRDVLSLLPTAVLPLQLTAEDELLQLKNEDRVYGLRSVYLEYQYPADGSAIQRLTLHDPAVAAAEVLAPLMGPAVEAVAPPFRPTRLEFNRTLPLASLRRPDGAAPRPGDLLLLQACADDWDDVSPGKGPGRSEQIEIRVVGPDDLDVALTQAEADLQQKLQRLREKELQSLQHAEDAEGRLKQVEAKQPKEGDPSEEAKKRLEEIAKLQKDVGDDLIQAQQLQREIQDGVSDDKTGVRPEALRLLDALTANGLQNTPARARMERVELELDRLAAVELRQIDPKLTAAKQEAMKDPKPIDARDKVDRKDRKERQAAEFDGEAKEAEQAARQLDESARATRDDQQMERLRKDADEKKEMASALRQAARRERQGGDAETPAGVAREDTAAAEDMQHEVERILNDLQSYSSTRDAKVEAGRILEEQRKLETQADGLEKQMLGKDAKDLTEAQRAELDELQNNQKRLEERAQQLLNRMKRTVDEPKELEKLAAEQDDLQKQIREAKTAKGLKELAKKQKDLAERTKQAADELQRLGAEQAAAAARQAADAMDKDAGSLEKGQKPEDEDAASKLLREARKENDPTGAHELKDALDKALRTDQDDAGLDGDMKRAAEELANNQLGEAKKDQEKAANKLQEMLGQLKAQEAAQREDDLDQLAKKLAEKQEELKKLADDQDELQKKIQATKDPKELEQLAKKQRALAEQTKQTADELQRLGAERAGASAKQAADAMDQNADRLEKGKKPENDDALDRLQDAQAEADDAQQDAQDQLEREKQARIADEVQRLKERQEGLNQEAARLHDTLAQNGARRDVLLNSVGGLRDSQIGLAGETETLAKKELADAPVLLRLMLRTSQSMTEAGDQLDEGLKAKPAAIGDRVLQAQQAASHRLSLVVDALKSEDPALPPPGGQQGGGPVSPNGDPTTQPDSVPPEAQLKLLRALQKEVNDRTGAFQKNHSDPSKYSDKDKAELEDIQKEQQDVIDLVEAFRHPSPPKNDGDKK